jgi:hypothetical protein
MGWTFRRSVNLGPFRVNLSKSGVGYSLGGPGFRTGVRSNGRRYSRVSLPGTGLSYTTSTSRSRGPASASGCIVILVSLGGFIGIGTWCCLT